MALLLIGIGSANLQAVATQMWLKVDGEWGYYDVTGRYTLHGNGTVTLHPPWRIENKGGGQWSNTRDKLFEITHLQKISVFSNNEELLLSSESLFNVSIYDLYGKSLYSANDKTDIRIDINTIPFANGSYILHMESKEGETKFMKLLFINNSFIISVPNK